MTYEEKRELRLQISQLLADAGLNQKAIKDMVLEEIKIKVGRGIDQTVKLFDAECSSGNYIRERFDKIIYSYITSPEFQYMIKEELKKRVIKIDLKNVELDK